MTVVSNFSFVMEFSTEGSEVCDEPKNLDVWFGHAKGTQDGEFTRRMYDSMIKGVGMRGRPPVT